MIGRKLVLQKALSEKDLVLSEDEVLLQIPHLDKVKHLAPQMDMPRMGPTPPRFTPGDEPEGPKTPVFETPASPEVPVEMPQGDPFAELLAYLRKDQMDADAFPMI